jgi:hypothetical protein
VEDLRPPIAALFATFGVAATVTPKDEGPIATSVIWISPIQDLLPADSAFARREGMPVMALRRDEVPRVPRGTVVLAPEQAGGEIVAWMVDGMERVETDHYRVFVLREE